MDNLHPARAGLSLAILFGGLHLAWALLIASGWGQVVTDFMLRLNFIKMDYSIDEFNISTALLLIAVTTSAGYILGWGFARLWNSLYK
jgi:hypothetical protein